MPIYYPTFQGPVGAIANLGIGVAALDDKALDDTVKGLRHTRGRQGFLGEKTVNSSFSLHNEDLGGF